MSRTPTDETGLDARAGPRLLPAMSTAEEIAAPVESGLPGAERNIDDRRLVENGVDLGKDCSHTGVSAPLRTSRASGKPDQAIARGCVEALQWGRQSVEHRRVGSPRGGRYNARLVVAVSSNTTIFPLPSSSTFTRATTSRLRCFFSS